MHVTVVGCGQLSRMLALAGIPLGFRFSFVAQEQGEDSHCVEQLGTIVRRQSGQSPGSLYELLGRPDVVTAEKEQVDAALLEGLAEFCDVHPNPASFATLQDRGTEKKLLEKLGIPSSPHLCGQTAAEAAARLSLPLVAKSRRDGYDGKNQQVLRDHDQVARFDAKGEQPHYIIEQWVPFDREISIISVRAMDGTIRHYPITQNTHENGILRHSIAPAPDVPKVIQQTAQDYISRIMHSLEYVGVMAMECFLVDGQLLVNEIAPRVHNSGHWTQSGCKTSQFENHLRAITALPLGSTEQHGVAGMVNLIGTRAPATAAFSRDSTMHWYNKVARPGRKLGHVNFCGESHEELLQKMLEFKQHALQTRTGR